MIKKVFCIFIFFFLSVNSALAEEDYCQLALENLYNKDSDLIAVIKINTKQTELYSSKIETSKDCQTFVKFFVVKNPDVIQTQGGLCAVLPADEIKPNLCALRVELCALENDCQSLTIKLIKEGNRYTKAVPAYFEMQFR